MINKQLFGTVNNENVYSYTLDNGRGLSCTVLTYGGILKNLIFRGTDVVLGRPSMEEYLDNDGYMGALIGRNSNRIRNAKFSLNGKAYTLYQNNNQANLHGGKIGFDQKIWTAEAADGEEPALLLTCTSPDGEEGFPGTVNLQVTYTLTRENALKIHYAGTCDQDTLLNMTNHSYFNLNGHKSGAIDSQTLQLVCTYYTPNDGDCIPTGEVLKVEGGAFDMRLPKTFAAGFSSDHPQIKLFEGFDNNFIIDGAGYRLGAVMKGDVSGITMEMYTDQPCVQVYTANCLAENRIGKEGAAYKKHHAVCLETQAVPNAINLPYFTTPILKKGAQYSTTTEYRFK